MTKASSRRINARLPAEVARKVAYLERRTHKSTTDVLRESIDRYYAAVTAATGSAEDAFTQAGFIGCARGDVELSSTYKRALAASWSDKA
jgi:hypothetical protein